MAYADSPYLSPALLRTNQYDRPCHLCGTVLPAGKGVAFLLWNEFQRKNKWHAACGVDYLMDAEQPDACITKIKAGETSHAPTSTGPLAAKAVVEQKSQEDLMTALETAPAFTMPDAAAMEPLIRQLAEAMTTSIVQDVAAQFTETVPGMVAELLASARPIAISVGSLPAVKVDLAHKALPDVLTMVAAGTSPFIVGPAGSGKTTLAEQIAKVLGRPFGMASRVSSEYKLTGFVDANGKTVRTAFREAYEHGHVFLFDEVDASDADALTAFNAALAGQLADFPDGVVKRHPDFVAIAAGNTFGRGADRQYVGRNQLDAATLDRFQVYEVDYDEDLELKLAGNAAWTNYVQSVRRAVEAEKVRHVVSPRASISGAKLIAAGWSQDKAAEACVWKGLDATNRARVVARMGGL